ncbi:hypothetical protein [Novosphingobium sp. 9U]|uniref:hypothetical protein n=1 Tax=Novosphingobium sp. 9U TaxID=2653158 RepID=UPI00135955F8|nr:hypothetical protein [Novosphingobium sp. 9U]
MLAWSCPSATPRLSLHLAEIALAVASGACRGAGGSSRLAHNGKLEISANISIVVLLAKMPRAQPGREHQAVQSRQLAFQKIAFSRPTTTSSTIAARRGTGSSINRGAS